MFKFELEASDGRARAGRLTTAHGEILTPVFMPVGTRATVKGMAPSDLVELDAGIILANAYHLLLRPGLDVIGKLGGLHRFMSWPRAILTDSGGFQVHSLKGLRRIGEDGVKFRSHIDGAPLELTPESVISAQHVLGSDVIMPLDWCASYPPEPGELEAAVRLTLSWAARSRAAHGARAGQTLFGIVQGGIDVRLRQASAEATRELGFEGYALGGFSVGEPVSGMLEALECACEVLPVDRPRYMMGCGTPSDLVAAVAQGVDMFDVVLPTRNARNGQAFTSEGRLNLRNHRFADDPAPLDPACSCSTCRGFSRAYLRHLAVSREMLGAMLLTHHNIAFFLDMMRQVRQSIVRRRFDAFRKELAARPT